MLCPAGIIYFRAATLPATASALGHVPCEDCFGFLTLAAVCRQPRDVLNMDGVCAVGNGEEFATDFQFAVEERMLVATAVAIADAVADASLVDGHGCRAGGDVCAATSPQCVSGNSLCGGTDRGAADVLPCCDPDFRCFVRDERRFFCRRRTFRPPRFWDGRIEECTLGLLG